MCIVCVYEIGCDLIVCIEVGIFSVYVYIEWMCDIVFGVFLWEVFVRYDERDSRREYVGG